MTLSDHQATITNYEKPAFGAWLVVGLLCIVGCLNYLDRVMITTMRESIIDSVPMTDAQFGLLTSVFLWVYGLLSPIAGYLADRFSRSRVIIFSLFIWSVVTWLTAHATTFEELLATRALMGLSEACYIPAALALISDYHKGSTRSLAIGIHMAGVMIGQSLGFLGGWIAETYKWNDAFTVFGGVGIFYAVILFFLLKDAKSNALAMNTSELSPEHTPQLSFATALKNLFSKKSFSILLIFWGLLGVIGWMILGWLPTYYKEHFNLSQTNAGIYATGYIYPLSMVGVVLGGYLADRWSKRNNKSRIFVPIIGLCVAAPAVFIASSTDMLYITVGGFMVYALTRVFSDTNLMPVLCMVVNKRYIATGYGVLNMFACIVGGLGIYASGALRDAHVDMSLLFKIASFTMVICAGLLYLVKKDVERSIDT
ncbi:MFS transporter [Pedobacter heparinus]|uniref:MFS transporter n=1 Tax=Pedobacter heparinus TaxID=984 RepID=UPI0029315C0A|nr:MFS transporter [Pedobacter heparinus]